MYRIRSSCSHSSSQATISALGVPRRKTYAFFLRTSLVAQQTPPNVLTPVGVSSKSSRLPSNVGRFHAEEVTHTHVLRTRRPIEENANLIMIQQVAVGPFLCSLFFHWRPLLKTAAGTPAAAERQDTCNNGFLSRPIFIRLKRMMLDIDKHPPNDWYMFYVFAFVCKS